MPSHKITITFTDTHSGSVKATINASPKIDIGDYVTNDGQSDARAVQIGWYLNLQRLLAKANG